MSVSVNRPILYPDSDGQPMADRRIDTHVAVRTDSAGDRSNRSQGVAADNYERRSRSAVVGVVYSHSGRALPYAVASRR